MTHNGNHKRAKEILGFKGMTEKTRVAVLGLDGVPFSLLQNFCSRGIMPNLSSLANNGSFLPMETSHPCVSSVAWTSFMTGHNPGVHGIYGFTDVMPHRIALKLPSFDDIQCPVVWNSLPGRKSVIVNLPFTYPARPLNGFLVSGFVAPIFERAVFPESLIPWLKARNYRIDVDTVRGRQDRQFLIRDLFETLEIHASVILELMESQPWDLFVGVITGTDRLHHFFFDACEDEQHPLHTMVVDFYGKVDSLVQRFVQSAGAFTRIILLSDHGFAGLRIQVYLNHILNTLGYLRYSTPEPRTLEDIDPRSRAFALDPSRIYINSRERFSGGAVSGAEVNRLRTKLQSQLSTLKASDIGFFGKNGIDAGHEEIFSEIKVREEVYHGPQTAFAPDLIVIPNRGYDLKAAIPVQTPILKDIFTGMHTHDDAFLLVGEPHRETRLPMPHITDVFPLITEIFR
jgi:predicted AlkP superfamily phosphohydrolase/phosphomutase